MQNWLRRAKEVFAVVGRGFCLRFFKNGMVFLSGRGGGQWGFLSQNKLATGWEGAGGGMAGWAQLGIVVLMGGVEGIVLGTVVGAV